MAFTDKKTNSARDAGPGDLSQTARWRAFWVCIAAGALTILDLSGVNVALPSIQKGLNASSAQLQLVVAGYALAFGLSLVPSGRLGDMRSRRKMFLIGLAAFALASAACALAQSDVWLTATRLVQGAAAGMLMPQVLGLIQQLFGPEDRPTAFGLFGAMVGVGTALGPTLCGLLIALGGETDGWRLLFWLNVPCGAAALLFALRLLPKKQDASPDTELDFPGLALLGAAVFCLMLPFLLTSGGQGDDPTRWLWLIGGVAFGTAFLFWERAYAARGKSPVVHLDLFRLTSYRNGTAIAALYFAGMPATFLVTTLYLQEGLGATPLLAALATVPFALSSAAAAWYGGKLVRRFGRSLVIVGTAIVALAVAGLAAAATLTPPHLSEWPMAGAMLVGGIGGGLVISPNQTLTLADVPREEGSVAGSIQQLGQRLGTAVGLAAISAVFFRDVRSGQHAPISQYHAGVLSGFAISFGLVVLTLVMGLIDHRQRVTSSLSGARA
ncbi:MFS transporter [Gryllotalpicola protaetiae]|uniref:MFS transporter n=1 Tax=Gryllotalpicola protaetiae TaxID=2419771 RepID=A0A387BWA1_9MICO|nr:MFS transporter [Gryllotalpicola protaetiae]AYG02661.1 MFS transporter [Gryllotalpicola protaetiae]